MMIYIFIIYVGKVFPERKMTLTPRPSDLENTPAQQAKADESGRNTAGL